MFEKIFIVATLSISWILSLIFIPQGAIGATTIIMMVPAILGFIITMIKYKSIKQPFKPLFYQLSIKGILFSFIFPLTIISLCGMMALVTGTGELTGDLSSNITQILTIVIMSIPFAIITLGEEYGWRGYLLVELEHKYGLKKANTIVGIVWCLFHLPAFFLINLSAGLGGAIVFTAVQVGCVFFVNFSYTYLYSLSKNVILVGVMHSVWNNVNTLILGDAYRNESIGIVSGNVNLINGERIYGLIFLGVSAYFISKILFKNVKHEVIK
ncbi:MAG: CPBP family intramembrane glutamic endopeptidase [Clostridiales bacterium]|nr:CPBP family intramembrane glutamic endopeptidase [Clostridiales bacterium]